MKKLLLIVILCCATILSYGQKKGYAGKIHQIQFDLGRVYWGYYQAEYKLSIGKHFGLAVTGGMLNKETPLKGDDLRNVGSITKLGFVGNTAGIGVVYNSPLAGMSMPVGFYSGLYYVRSFGTLNEFLPSGKIYNGYDFKGNLIKLYYGKNIVLHQFLTLDIGLGIGAYWGNLTPNKLQEAPVGITPSPVPISTYSTIDSEFYGGYGYNRIKVSFIKLYIMPEIKLGYMF